MQPMVPYGTIINLKNHKSKTHPPMPIASRAAQFAPFAALTGYEESLSESSRVTAEKRELGEEREDELNRKIQYLKEHVSEYPMIKVIYFIRDSKKQGGHYQSLRGNVRIVDTTLRLMVFIDGIAISIDDVYDIELSNA